MLPTHVLALQMHDSLLQSNYVGVSSDLLQKGQACGRCIKLQASAVPVAALLLEAAVPAALQQRAASWFAGCSPAQAQLHAVTPVCRCRPAVATRGAAPAAKHTSLRSSLTQLLCLRSARVQCDDVSCKDPGKMELPAIVADVCGACVP